MEHQNCLLVHSTAYETDYVTAAVVATAATNASNAAAAAAAAVATAAAAAAISMCHMFIFIKCRLPYLT